MMREISAGGVVVRRTPEGWQIAVIEPNKDISKQLTGKADRKRAQKMLLALPKGLVDSGEKPDQTAMREVLEESGIRASVVTKLGDIKYAYVRSWGDKQRVFKIVSFYLLRYESGNIGEISPEMRVEVKQALWLPLEDATSKLAYKGERDMVRRAQEYLQADPELMGRLG
jgi:8-oxo-dGTP pyrophosphatase MutT (NUDIX family)